jgi:DNA polymerase
MPIPKRTLAQVRAQAAGCRACELWKCGTQTVFGEGPARPRLFLVGEQPGDYEDREGVPFVGPAGRLLERALAAAGLERDQVYLTNVVKHFKWTARGKRRIHEKPNAREVRACRPWLDAELRLTRPRVVVCLGATAAQALLGARFRVSRDRGRFIPSPLAEVVMATVHPASVLRVPGDAARHDATLAFIADIRRAARKARST